MPLTRINLGTAANDGTGDNLRAAGGKINSVMDAVDALTGGGGTDFTALATPIIDAVSNPTTPVTDPNYKVANQLKVTLDDEALTNPGFTTIAGRETTVDVRAGQYAYGTTNQSKKTVIADTRNMTRTGAVQGFLDSGVMTSYAQGDSAIGQYHHYFAGGPKAGDEGQAFRLFCNLYQQQSLCLLTISSVARSGASTTLTQAITASKTAQTFSVASASGIAVNDWIVLSHDIPSDGDMLEAVKVTAVSGNNLTAVCMNNHLNGATVKPALVLNMGDTSAVGELRVLVNLSGAAYTTGTFSSVSGGAVTFSGTTLANNMVGGDASNIGAISFDADTYTGAPFSGTGSNGPLRSWYQITSVNSTTNLGVHRTSVAGDAALVTRAASGGAFKVLPAVRVLKVLSNQALICEPSVATWSAGNSVECTICPYPDVTGFNYNSGIYTPGANKRAFTNILTSGAVAFDAGIRIGRYNTPSPTFDTHGFEKGLTISHALTGLQIDSVQPSSLASAINITYNGDGSHDAAAAIKWGSGDYYIRPSGANLGLKVQSLSSGLGGTLEFLSPNGATVVDANMATMHYNGSMWLDGVGAHYPFLQLSAPGPFPATGGTARMQYTATNNLNNAPGLDFVLDTGGTGGTFVPTLSLSTPDASPAAPGAGQGPIATATSNTTNKQSASFQQVASVWNGTAAAKRYVDLVALPDTGVNNATLWWVVRMSTPNGGLGYNASFPNLSFAVSDTGKIKFGDVNPNNGYDHGATLDASALTAQRTFSMADVTGVLPTLSSGGAPTSSTDTGKKGEVRYVSGTLYVCVADNTWVKTAVTTSF